MKKQIDIEKLLQWSLRDELPKGRPVSVEIGQVIARRGSRSGSIAAALAPRARSEPDALGFVPGSPHEDAERVADAVAALDRRTSFAVTDDARRMFDDIGALGDHYAGSLMVASFNPQALIVCHGIGGTRPRWQFDVPTPYRMQIEFKDDRDALRKRPLVEGLDSDGALIALTPNRGRAAMARGQYDVDREPRSPLAWDNPSPLHIGHQRGEYVAWHGALIALVDRLRDRLREFEAVLPKAPALPWITGAQEVSRVLPVLGFDPAILSGKLALQPKRRAALPPLESDIERRSRLYRRSSRPAADAESEPAAGTY